MVFTRRLREMDGQAKAGLAEALKKASGPALVRSAFDLPAEQRTAIQNALNETFSAEIRVRFETAPELISGFELSTNGQKVSWSIADYLASLEKGVEELLKEKDKPKTKTSTDLTSQITKRAHELYEERGHKNDSASQDWNQAEQEIRKAEVKAEPKPEAKAEAKPEAKAEPKPKAKAESKPEESRSSGRARNPSRARTRADWRRCSAPIKISTNCWRPWTGNSIVCARVASMRNCLMSSPALKR